MRLGPFLVVGLGNPGVEYAGHRHNIGFMAVDRIAEDYGFSRPAKKFGGAVCEGIIGTQKIHAFKPLGYMNTSGGPAAEAARFYKIPPEQLIVIHDELDLPLGKLRVKRGGGHGGHNGLKSLDARLGKDYWRVRMGIGHPGDKDLVTDYVLSDFLKQEKPAVDHMLHFISKHIFVLLDGNSEKFMNDYAKDPL